MSNKEIKNTIRILDIMVRNADKGPSGFWVDDYEGCGNPQIFPEFAEGLKNGSLVQKPHYICPWNTAVLYGEGHGNINDGCYYSCSIKDARYLSADMLKDILTRFKNGLQSGQYDDLNHLMPLITADEQAYIKKQKLIEERRIEQQCKAADADRKKRASALMNKYQGNEKIQDLLAHHYGDKRLVITEHGLVDFNPEGMVDIVSKKEISYDEYLDLQFQSLGKYRSWFEMCYYNIPDQFMGRIEKKGEKNICFEQIYVSGMYADGCSSFFGKENHVWMEVTGFEEFEEGDCVSFFPEVYRYVKTGNGKVLDYSLRNPTCIEKISSYQLPSDDQIIRQSIDQIICETCIFSEHCNQIFCLRNPEELNEMQEQMFEMIKGEFA